MTSIKTFTNRELQQFNIGQPFHCICNAGSFELYWSVFMLSSDPNLESDSEPEWNC